MFSKKLKEHREKLGLTQSKLSSQIGVTQKAVSQWERGESMPSSSKLPLLARLLECSVNDLFDEQELGR